MPLYEYRCDACGTEFTDILPMSLRNDASCPKCGARECKRLYRSVSVHIWQPQWFEHIDDKPIYIESKKQLKRECEKRGLVPLALE